MVFWCWIQPHSCKKKPFQEGLLDHVWTRWLVISAISSYFWKIRHDDMMLFFLSKHVQNILGQDWELHLPTGLRWWKPHVLGRPSAAESRRKHCFAMKKWLEMVVSPRMQLNRTYRCHNVSSPSMLLAFLQSVMEVPWLSRIITLENGHLNSQTVPCRRWNHRSRSLDQILVVYKSTFVYLSGFWMDLFLDSFLFRCKIFQLRMAAGQPAKSGLWHLQSNTASRCWKDTMRSSTTGHVCRNKEKCMWNKSSFDIIVVFYVVLKLYVLIQWSQIRRRLAYHPVIARESILHRHVSVFSPGWNTLRTLGMLRIALNGCRTIQYDA